MSLDFSVIGAAGLTQTEFAQLLSAQRVTVNNWVNGRSVPHTMWRKKCQTQLALISYAMRLNLLPGDLPPIYKENMAERMDYVRDALREAARRAREKQSQKPSDDTLQ